MNIQGEICFKTHAVHGSNCIEFKHLQSASGRVNRSTSKTSQSNT